MLRIKFHVSHLKHVHSRFFYVSDSYVCMSVVSKGRSGSRRLIRLLKQINAYLLGFNLPLIISHVESSENTTDGASRKLEIFAIAGQKPSDSVNGGMCFYGMLLELRRRKSDTTVVFRDCYLYCKMRNLCCTWMTLHQNGFKAAGNLVTVYTQSTMGYVDSITIYHGQEVR